MQIKLEHIDALSRGKKSGIRIGSRAVPHHLYAHERTEYERALKRGYLTIESRSRVNLENLWMLVTESREIPCYILKKLAMPVGHAQILQGDAILFTGPLHEARTYIQSLIHS